MRKTSSLALSVLLLGLFTLPALSQEVNVTGTWDLTVQLPRGERTSEVTFTQDGEKLTVMTTDRQGQEVKGEGTIKGNAIEWSVTRETPRGTFAMTYKGTVEGDSMKGTVQMGDFGSAEWKAAKKK